MSTWKVHCQNCKIYFERKKRLYKNCPHFCTVECYREFQKKYNQWMSLTCVHCGKKFQAHRSKKVLNKNGHPKFCSFGCRDGGLPGFSWKNSNEEETKKHLQLQFDKFVVKSEGCWKWIGNFDKQGYAILGVKNLKYRMAHRVSWYLKYGSIPDGIAAHTCDKKFCTNPLHIFFTDNKGNSLDWKNKGLSLKGEKNGSAKLKEKEVVEIKKLLNFGMKHKEIAKKFNIGTSSIHRIAQNITWKHIPD